MASLRAYSLPSVVTKSPCSTNQICMALVTIMLNMNCAKADVVMHPLKAGLGLPHVDKYPNSAIDDANMTYIKN